MKRIYLGLAASVLLAVSSFPSYAGQWKQDTEGWKYENDDHTFLQNQWFRDYDGKWYYFSQEQGSGYGQLLTGTTTPDGYTVNENGEWVQ